jgi:hypothetical protein
MKHFRFLALIAAIGLASFSIKSKDYRTVSQCGFPTRVHAMAAMQTIKPAADEAMSAYGTYYNINTGSYCYTVTLDCQ